MKTLGTTDLTDLERKTILDLAKDNYYTQAQIGFFVGRSTSAVNKVINQYQLTTWWERLLEFMHDGSATTIRLKNGD